MDSGSSLATSDTENQSRGSLVVENSRFAIWSCFDWLEQAKGDAQWDRKEMPYYFSRFQFLVAVLVLTNVLEVICPMEGNYIVI